jgi:hypothetical protein
MIRILTENDYPETYKLDISIVYTLEKDGREIPTIPSSIVLETLGEAIEGEIESNKKKICSSNKFKDFEIEYQTFNDKDGILVYTVRMDRKIIGDYFVKDVSRILRGYQTIVFYKGRELNVTVENVEPMLRYVGVEE